MRHGSLFSGIGGFDLAAEWVGWENVFQVEIDKFCTKVLEKNFPNVKRYGDIKEFDGTQYRGAVDILSGGPPCQPASNAGKRKGEKDNRWLWPEAIRVFGEIRPTYGVFENPDDLLSLDNGKSFERICSQMEDFGYRIRTVGIPACCVGAWHERDRIWIIADTNSKGLSQPAPGKLRSISKSHELYTGRPINGTSSEIGIYWEIEPSVVRMVHGISNRMDRIKALGNSIVPQVAYEIFKAIEQYELTT